MRLNTPYAPTNHNAGVRKANISENAYDVDARGLPGAAISGDQPEEELPRGRGDHPASLVDDIDPTYTTSLGAAYSGDAIGLSRALPSASVNLVVTSRLMHSTLKKNTGTLISWST